MGRHMLPRLGIAAQPLADTRGGVELHIVESHNVFPSPSGSVSESPENEWRALTLLLNLSDDEADRAAFRELGQAFPFARGHVQVVPLDDGFAGLRAALAPFAEQASWVTAIVFERPRPGAEPGLAEVLAAALQDLLQHRLSLVAGVSAGPVARGGPGGVLREVRGASTTTRATALSLFVMLASLMAPDTYNCVDFCDLDPLWENEGVPAVLAEAVWLREAQQLGFASQDDQQTVRRAAGLFAVPLGSALRGQEQRQVINVLRAEMRQPDSLLYFVPLDALASSRLHARFILLPMLCAGASPNEGQ